MDHIQNIMENSQQLFPFIALFSCILDFLLISYLRDILHDFLIGQRNRKSARKIHHAQSLKDRIFLGYILVHLTRYQKDFKIYHGLYVGELCSCLPLFVIFCAVWFWNHKIGGYGICALVLIKLLLFIYVRCQIDGTRHSVYARGK